MKASVKFREDQTPLFKAKVPLNILGLPFQSALVAGQSKELSLNLSTFFQSGPSIRFSYRPNDAYRPFSLTVKSGTGPFGSPLSASLLMSAEFNLLGQNKNSPSFMLHFKPSFGDFSIKKAQSSSTMLSGGVFSDDDGSIEVVESPVGSGEAKSATVAAMASAFRGVEVSARTKVPVMGRAVVSFWWGVRAPAEICGVEAVGGIDWRKMPFLVMDKVGFEHVESGEVEKKGVGEEKNRKGDVEEACFAVKRQLEGLRAENGMLRKAVDELREEFAGGRVKAEVGSGRFREEKSVEKRVADGCVNDELKKAMKGVEVKKAMRVANGGATVA